MVTKVRSSPKIRDQPASPEEDNMDGGGTLDYVTSDYITLNYITNASENGDF